MFRKPLCTFVATLLFSLCLQAQDIQVKVGGTSLLQVDVSSGYVFERGTWTSENESVAKVESRNTSTPGNTVIGVSAGKTRVVCNYVLRMRFNDQKYTTSKTFTIVVDDGKPKSVSISPSTVELIAGGASETLYANVEPYGADFNNISWSSSNESVASVSKSGTSATVTPHSIGRARITATVDNGVSGSRDVIVYGNSPTSISITGPSEVDAETEHSYSVDFNPNDQHSALTWTSSDNSVISVSSKGVVKAVNIGKATVTVRTANSLTATKEIAVKAPTLAITETRPAQNATDFNVTSIFRITFSNAITEGPNFSKIALHEGNGYSESVECVSDITSPFTTDEKIELQIGASNTLKPNTRYRLLIPAGAVVNKWGGTIDSDYVLYFQTGELNKMTLNMRKEGKKVYLDCSEYFAQIRYTLDGSEPTLESGLPLERSQAIDITENVMLWAKAYLDGYVTPQVKQEVRISIPNVVAVFPAENEHLANYYNLLPYVEFDKNIQWNIQSPALMLKESTIGTSYYYKPSEPIIARNRIVFIPDSDDPLDRDSKYMVQVPAGVVANDDGELNEEFSAKLGTTVSMSSSLTGLEVLEPVIYLEPGEKSVVLVKPKPLKAYFVGHWSSSNTSVVSTNWLSKGVIEAKQEGVATVTVEDDGIMATCTVCVGKKNKPLTVAYTNPENGAVDVPIWITPVVTFSDEIEFNTSNPDFAYSHFSLKDTEGKEARWRWGPDIMDRSLRMFVDQLKEGMLYTFTIPAKHIKMKYYDAVNEEDITISFTTEGSATAKPHLTLIRTRPADGATDVVLDVIPLMEFSGTCRTHKETDYNKIALTKSDGTVIPRGPLNTAGSIVWVEPTQLLEPLTTYTFTIGEGVFIDPATDEPTTQSFSFSFTTGIFTGISKLSTEKSPADIYDLHGRKIRTKATSTDRLPKGLYVTNGKKIVVR
mgnify:FL=1